MSQDDSTKRWSAAFARGRTGMHAAMSRSKDSYHHSQPHKVARWPDSAVRC
jgi:hypothetical protein